MKFRTIIKKYAVDSAIKFPKKSILRQRVFTKTVRQRESSFFNVEIHIQKCNHCEIKNTITRQRFVSLTSPGMGWTNVHPADK